MDYKTITYNSKAIRPYLTSRLACKYSFNPLSDDPNETNFHQDNLYSEQRHSKPDFRPRKRQDRKYCAQRTTTPGE